MKAVRLLVATSLLASAAAAQAPDIRSLWNYSDPAASEARFRAARQQVPARSPQDAELRTQEARAQGLQEKFAQATRTLDEAERILDALPPPPPPEGGDLPEFDLDLERARVRLHLERGRVANSSGDKAGAIPHFEAAHRAADQVGLRALAIDAMHMLAIAHQDPVEQEKWNLLALERAATSVDPAAQRWVGALTNNLGFTYLESGRAAEALVMFERGLAYRRGQPDASAERVARWTVARALRALGRIDEAQRIQLRLVKDCLAAGEPDGYVHEELGELYSAQGRWLLARVNYRRAHELLSQLKWLQSAEPERLEKLAELGGVR